MPLSLLLCEGVAGSPDARVLAKLVAGRCAIEPAGSKYGLDSQVLIRRTIINGLVAGLRDADFDRDWTGPEANPEIWSKHAEGGVAHRLGWCWRRKEIENYLIDPIVVSNALGLNAPDLAVYRTLLEKAATSSIAIPPPELR